MDKEFEALPRGYVQVETSTSKTLQMLIHFNAYLSVIYIVMEIVVLVYKLQTYELEVFGKVLTPLTFGVWSAAEAFRLWFGFTGNLQEKLPQLSVFFLLSLFPQLPCLLYLMQLQQMQLPFERVAGYSVFALTVLELAVTYRAVRNLVKKQTRSYVRLVEEMDNDN